MLGRVGIAVVFALALIGGACDADGPGSGEVGETSDVGEASDPGEASEAGGDCAETAPLPVPRTEVAGALWRDAVVVVGGLLEDGTATGAVDSFECGRWTSLPRLPVPLHHAGAAVLDDRLHVVGGYAPGSTPSEWRESARAFSLGEGETAWRDEPPLASPRGALGVVAAGGVIVAFGGVSGGQPVATTEILRAGQPPEAGPNLREAREHTASAALGTRVYAIAGRTGAPATNKTSVEVLDVADLAAGWQRGPDLSDARGGTSATAVADRVCVTGGETATETIGSIECLDGDRWQTVGRLRQARHGLAVVGVGDTLHVIAGGDEPGLTVTSTHESIRI